MEITLKFIFVYRKQICLVIILLAPAPLFSDSVDFEKFLGKWIHLDNTVYFYDGRTYNYKDYDIPCWSEYTESQLISECRYKDKSDRAVYNIKLLKPGTYRQTLVENKRTPHLIGSEFITSYEFKLDNYIIINGNKLYISTQFPIPQNPSPDFVVKIESVLFKD